MIIKTNYTIGYLISVQRHWIRGVFIGAVVFLIFSVNTFTKSSLVIILLVITILLSPTIYSIIYALSKKGILCEHSIEITPNFLRETTSFNDTYYEWQKIRKILKDKYDIFIMLDKRAFLCIKRKDFSTQEEFDECFTLIQKYHSQAITKISQNNSSSSNPR